MQSISAIAWFPTVALICGLVFGVLALGYACLMIIKEQRPSGIPMLLAILGALLLVVSIWQSRSGTINELQAKIVDLEQQNRKLAQELEETSGQQRTQGTTLSDANTQLKTSLTSLQKDETQRKQQIEILNHTQTQLHQSFTEVRQQIDQQFIQMQQLRDKQQQMSADIQNQLKDITNSYSIKIAEHEQLLNKTMDQIAQLKSAQPQTDLESLREEVEATSLQGRELNLVKASTQRELSALRRDVQQLQTNIQQLQGRRHRAP